MIPGILRLENITAPVEVVWTTDKNVTRKILINPAGSVLVFDQNRPLWPEPFFTGDWFR